MMHATSGADPVSLKPASVIGIIFGAALGGAAIGVKIKGRPCASYRHSPRL